MYGHASKAMALHAPYRAILYGMDSFDGDQNRPPPPREEHVRFAAGSGACAGTLTVPAEAQSAPAVVLCAGFSGTQDTPAVRAAAASFAQAGYAALTFDYRGFGVSEGQPRQLIDLGAQRADIRGAFEFLQADDRIDRDRIALWGTSLGGGHVVVVAADLPDVAAVVAQVPFNGFPRRVEGRSGRDTARLLWAMLVDRARGVLRMSPKYIPAVGPSGSLAVMASADAARTIETLESETWRNQVTPGVLFDMMAYHPDRAAARLTAPLLTCLATRDRESPEVSARRIAEAASDATLLTYPISHFEIYRPDVRRRVLADQIAFLNDRLRDGGQASSTS